jgi:hypothetical protein
MLTRRGPGQERMAGTAVVRLIDATHRAGGTSCKLVLSRGLEFMNVACCVHPLAVWAHTAPLALASGSLIASVLATLAISLRLLGIRAREAAESPFRDRLLPDFAAAWIPARCAQTRSLSRSPIDRAPTLLRAPPSSAEAWQDSTSERPQCARAESAAIAAVVTVDHDTPPPPPARLPLVHATPVTGSPGVPGELDRVAR